MTATAVPKSDIGQQRYRHSRSAAMGMHSPASTKPLNSITNPLFQGNLISGSPRYQKAIIIGLHLFLCMHVRAAHAHKPIAQTKNRKYCWCMTYKHTFYLSQRWIFSSIQLYSGHRSVHICTVSWEFRNKVRVLEETFVLDVKKETYDQKHIDDENLDKARHLKKLTVDDV